MHHEVHLRNIQLEANKYEKSAINAELAHPLCTEKASKRAPKVHNRGLQRGTRNAEQESRTYCNTDTKIQKRC